MNPLITVAPSFSNCCSRSRSPLTVAFKTLHGVVGIWCNRLSPIDPELNLNPGDVRAAIAHVLLCCHLCSAAMDCIVAPSLGLVRCCP